MIRAYLAERDGPGEPDVAWALRRAAPWLALGMLLLGLALGLALLGGCANGAPTVSVTHLEGAGRIDIENCVDTLPDTPEQEPGSLVDCRVSSIAFAEEGREVEGPDGPELVHCSVVKRLVLLGLSLGVGILPEPLSDARCEGARWTPFPSPALEQHEPVSRDLVDPPRRRGDGRADRARPGDPSTADLEVTAMNESRPAPPSCSTPEASMPRRQVPTVGRIVHYYHSRNDVEGQCPNAALVAHIWSDEIVNLDVSPNAYHSAPYSDGQFEHSQTSVPYAAEPTPGHWCWPPRA